jgi:phosphonopyruvate decarboxylase
LSYLSAANEGDAFAAAAGAAIGGKPAVVMMQNSGLGNAVNPITSLAYSFRIPLLLICTWRGEPGLKDEPQHELMGRITGRLFEDMEVPWELFPAELAEIEPVLARASQHFARERRPYALIMRKGSVAKHALKRDPVPRPDRGAIHHEQFPGATRVSRQQALERILKHTPEQGTVVVATTGYTGRELFALSDRPNQLYMVGSMGCAASLGLGLSLARPDLRVVVIDGDGAALMRMGNFATIGAYGGANLVHIVLDNEAHDSTGAQATVAATVSFTGVAAACGYTAALEGKELTLIDRLFALETNGPRLGHLKIRAGTVEDLPRPNQTPVQVLDRLMKHIGTSFA